MMSNLNKLLLCGLLLCGGLHLRAAAAPDADVARYVNPFIGTGAVSGGLCGNNYPGATVPFGLVQLSPDTGEAPSWNDASGYDYNSKQIYGFSHTRLSGTGACDLIDVLLLPTTGNRRVSAFSHEQERATPGYYSVRLADDDILAELTATCRVGLHRYTYNNKESGAHLWVDLDHSAVKGDWGRRIIQSQLRLVTPTVMEGYRIITGWAKLRKVCFRIEFSRPVLSHTIYRGDQPDRTATVANGDRLRALLDFGQVSQLECRVSISPISVENARENMQAEVAGKGFDDVRHQAYATWNKALSRMYIQSTDEVNTIFYTALYHALIQPNTFSDVNGQYMASDFTVRSLPAGEVHYTTFSLWDTYRAAHPLYTILEPVRSVHFVNSMIRQYTYYGYLPIWQLWGQDNYCMIGNHAVPVVVDAVLKGLPGIDAEQAWQAVKGSLTTSHLNSPFDVWEEYGYMPEDLQTQSVSITLEQCFDDWCAARLAEHLGHESDRRHFDTRAAYYANLHHPDTRFFQPRNSRREWIADFDPYKYGANGGYPFTEGNAWQYYWYVPHNVPRLIELTGGREAFCRRLDEFFTSKRTSGEKNSNASGFVGLYAHGNEPSHHVAYLYAMAGVPWRTQQLTDYIKRELYNTSPSGYAGNDDCGEMSAWYIFSALGFYPVNPAAGEYVIGAPTVDGAVLNLPNGRTFTIEVSRRNSKAIYVKEVLLNGKRIKDYILTHQALMAGGTLRFVMTDKVPAKPLQLD